MPFEQVDPPGLRLFIQQPSRVPEGSHIALRPRHKTESEKTEALTESIGLTNAPK